jgi:hypothetical protein
MSDLRGCSISIHGLDSVIDRSHTGGEPKTKRSVHCQVGIVDDGSRSVVWVVDPGFLALFVGESGIPVMS